MYKALTWQCNVIVLHALYIAHQALAQNNFFNELRLTVISMVSIIGSLRGD